MSPLSILLLANAPQFSDPVPSRPPAPPEAAEILPAELHWFDLDGDGDEDAIALDRSGRLKLLRNDAGVVFVDVTLDSGLSRFAWVGEVLAGDWDADGDADLVLAAEGRLSLAENDRGLFVERPLLEEDRAPVIVRMSWIDADGDARPDLHLTTATEHLVVVNHSEGFEEVTLDAGVQGIGETALPVLAGAGTRVNPAASPSPGTSRTGSAGSPHAPAPGGPTPGPAAPSTSTALCLAGVEDQATGSCLGASSEPTLGMLYPITSELFVDSATGRVGIGTTTPGYALEVAGKFVSGSGNTPTGLGASIGGGTANNATGEHAVIAGGDSNQALADDSFIGGGVSNLVVGQRAVIAGGVGNSAANSTAVGGGEGNSADFGFSTIAGGRFNQTGAYAAVGGGGNNSATGSHSVVGGGGDGADALSGNTASGSISTVSGGRRNTATDTGASVGGGESNNATGDFGTVAGGFGNSVFAPYGVVPGGRLNVSAGVDSMAAGRRAKALHDGTFVWADSADADFSSTAPDQFLVRAAGGVGLGKAPDPSMQLDVEGSVRTSDTFVSTKPTGAPLQVASSDLNANLNADLLDGLDSSAFSQLGDQVEGPELADGAVTNAKVAAGAGIAGTKISPNFGILDVVTFGDLHATDATLSGRLTALDDALLAQDLEVSGTVTTQTVRATNLSGSRVEVGGDHVQATELVGAGIYGPSDLLVNENGGSILLGPAGGSNVGIGTYIPQAPLDVQGDIRSSGTVTTQTVRATDLGGSRVEVGGDHVQAMELVGAGIYGPSDLLVNEDGGSILLGAAGGSNVGIGTYTPQAPLDVEGDIRSTGEITAYNPNNPGASAHLSWSDDVARIRVGGSGAGASAGLDIQTQGDTSLLRILGSGDVGLGTTAPGARLHVQSGTDASPARGGYVVAGALDSRNLALDDNEIMARNNGAPSLLSLNAEGGNVRILGPTGGGSVGIGTTSPQARLDVDGNVRSTGTIRSTGSNSGIAVDNPSQASEELALGWSSGRAFLDVDGSADGIDISRGGNPWVSFRWNGTEQSSDVYGKTTHNSPVRFNAGGDFIGELTALVAAKPGGGPWSELSDARLKKDVEDLDGALETLLRLRGVTFEFIDPEGIGELPGRRTGFIAQEVEEVLPDWVEERENGYKQLSIRGFTALAVEALRDLRQEKDAEIEELRTANAALEARLDRLEAMHLELVATHRQQGSSSNED